MVCKKVQHNKVSYQFYYLDYIEFTDFVLKNPEIANQIVNLYTTSLKPGQTDTILKFLYFGMRHGQSNKLYRISFILDPEKERLVAFCRVHEDRKESLEIWLGSVMVNPEYRGQKFCKKILCLAMTETEKLPKKYRFNIIVEPNNTPAKRCYESVGFTNLFDNPTIDGIPYVHLKLE